MKQALTWMEEGRLFDVGLIDLDMPDLTTADTTDPFQQYVNSQTLPLVLLHQVGMENKTTQPFPPNYLPR